MKAVKDLCIIQENALNINVSDQIEQLNQLINDHDRRHGPSCREIHAGLIPSEASHGWW